MKSGIPLRLGVYDHPVALFTHRCDLNEADWQLGKGHLGIKIVTEGFFVSKIGIDSSNAFVYRYGKSIDLRLILEPQPRTPQHKLYQQWEAGGAARCFYRSIQGLRGGHAFVTPTLPAATLPPRWAADFPHSSGGYATMLSEQPAIVHIREVGAYLLSTLDALGVKDPVDLRTIANCILAELGRQLR